MNVRITGIAGSLRRESCNRKLLHAAAHEMPHGAELTVWDGLGAVPPFSEDLEAAPAPAGVTDLRQVIAEADGLLFATPEYNGSVPGQLKNAIDWASRPPRGGVLQGKPAAVISASPTPYGAAWAHTDLRKILKIAGADICDSGLAVPRIPGQLTPGGLLADPAMNRGLTQVIADLRARAAAPAARQAAQPHPHPGQGPLAAAAHVADLVRRVDTMRHDQAKQHQEELMYAIVRQYTYDPATIARAEQALAAAQGLHAAQPGYAGGLVIDDGQHVIAVNLWQTEHHAAAGRVAIGTQVQRLLEPLMATPSQLLGAGEVVATDLADHQ
jgi:chromate reductase